MNNIVDLLWEQIEPTVFIGKDQFCCALKEWEIETVEIGGQIAFAALTKGPEFHFASFETGHQITRKMIWERLKPIFNKHGQVTTRTPKENATRQHRLNKILGFKAIGEDEFFVHYRLENVKCL